MPADHSSDWFAALVGLVVGLAVGSVMTTIQFRGELKVKPERVVVCPYCGKPVLVDLKKGKEEPK